MKRPEESQTEFALRMVREEERRNVLAPLVRRGVVTMDLSKAVHCCGIERDDDGFCRHREYHPIFIHPEG